MPVREWKRENVWLRMCLVAPTGAGKTLAALAVGSTIFGGELPLVGLDTEYERMKLYADAAGLAQYRVIEDNFAPKVFIREINEIEAEFRGGVLVIDSVSHEWNSAGGVLTIADTKGGGNWKDATPEHNAFVDRLMRLQMHLIVCCRAKMKYEYTTGEDGKRKQHKMGVGPEQRDNFLYNFDVVADIDASDHLATFTNRCRPLVDKTFNLVPDLDDLKAPNPVAEIITLWLSEGDPPVPVVEANPADIDELENLLLSEGLAPETISQGFTAGRAQNKGVLPQAWVDAKVEAARARIAAAAATAETAEQTFDAAELPRDTPTTADEMAAADTATVPGE